MIKFWDNIGCKGPDTLVVKAHPHFRNVSIWNNVHLRHKIWYVFSFSFFLHCPCPFLPLLSFLTTFTLRMCLREITPWNVCFGGTHSINLLEWGLLSPHIMAQAAFKEKKPFCAVDPSILRSMVINVPTSCLLIKIMEQLFSILLRSLTLWLKVPTH